MAYGLSQSADGQGNRQRVKVDTHYAKGNRRYAIGDKQYATCLTLAAALLRVLPLTENRFHPDEALYASFARLIASGRDPLLASVVVDKPPLPFYLMAASMTLFGPSELAARLPSLFASVVSLALLCALARALYGRQVASLAGLFFALSPFAISFAVTAFTDPLQVAFLLWAALAVARGNWGWSGLAAALALATKQTTTVFVPLIVGLGIMCRVTGDGCRVSGVTRHSPLVTRLSLFILPLLLSAALMTLWDFSRHAAIGFWAQGYSDNVPGRFIRSVEVWPRLAELGALLSLFTASSIVNVLFLVGLPLLLIDDVLHRPRQFASLVDLGLVTFLLLYLGAYWLLAFNLWDRYFLAILPLACLLLARAACHVSSVVSQVSRVAVSPPRSTLPAPRRPRLSRHSPLVASLPLFIAHCSLFILLLPPALTAAHSGFPIGGDHGAYDGIDEAARYLRTLPKGAVLYDRWLSWEWNYYLDDAAIYLVWMPDPQTLARDLQAFGRTSPRYFVSPSWESDVEFQQAANGAGFTFQPVLTTHRRDGSESFVVYEVVGGNW